MQNENMKIVEYQNEKVNISQVVSETKDALNEQGIVISDTKAIPIIFNTYLKEISYKNHIVDGILDMSKVITNTHRTLEIEYSIILVNEKLIPIIVQTYGRKLIEHMNPKLKDVDMRDLFGFSK